MMTLTRRQQRLPILLISFGLFALASSWLAGCVANAQNAAAKIPAFEIGQSRIEPGTRGDMRLPVAARGDEPGTFIPVSVIHGARPGPILATVSGVHGYEFSPILAADRLADRIDPGTLAGTLIIVRIANIPAYEGRSPFVSPVDGKNLNRAFPGSASGTVTERIADVISREIVARADFLIDIHGGDGAEFLDAFVGVYGGPLASDFDGALAVARGFGFANIVRYAMNTQAQVDTRRALNRQGVAAGIPTILVEIGENGSRDEADVEAIVKGVENALRTLAMRDTPAHNVPPALRLFEGTVGVSASHSGLFFPAATGGRYLWKGDLIGIIRDYTGKEVERLHAPINGYALYGIQGPPVRAGDSVITIGVPLERF